MNGTWDQIAVEKIVDLLEEGVIVIDENGIIQLYNRKAQEIFGLNLDDEGPGHLEGQLMDGDWVLLADNWLGRDDGGLRPEDLSIIGVNNPNLASGMAVVAIGRVGSKPGQAQAKVGNLQDWRNRTMQITVQESGHQLSAAVEHRQHRLLIQVDEKQFFFPYRFAAGHLLVLDGMSFEVKFYQARGYTARGESVREILLGKPYRAKGYKAERQKIIGQPVAVIHPATGGGDRLMDAIHQGTGIQRMELEINGIATLCKADPLIVEGKKQGAILIIEDIQELRYMKQERDSALANLHMLEKQIRHQKKAAEVFERVVGRSTTTAEVIRLAERAAVSNSTVLLLGESGTGKGLIAQAIHDASPRSDGPFVTINCASIPENLLESELFGYEGGAFTGANREGKPGKFELAHGGTIFLDEIGDLPQSMQAKLLHVLQERKIQRVGGTRSKDLDFRIIAATNRDLGTMVQVGEFREDLYYRIHVIALDIPPLRERREDIPDLISYLLPRICQKVGIGLKSLGPETVQYLIQYNWPGNVRELENLLEMLVSITPNDLITPDQLPQRITANRTGRPQPSVKIENLTLLNDLVETCEREAICEALRQSNGNRTRAMELLGIGRTQFYEKLKRYQIG